MRDRTGFVRTTPSALVAVYLVAFAAVASSAIRRVPDTYPTIGAAIAASASGDSVLIGAGQYFENLVTGDRFLTFIGTAGSAQTILDGSNAGRVVSLDRGGRLHGLTIRHGQHLTEGGGVRVRRGAAPINTASFLMEDCDVIENSATLLDGSTGGGLMIGSFLASAVVRRCRFVDNSSYYQGGAVHADYPAHFEDCEFRESYGGLFGGAVYSAGASIVRCLFIGNRAEIAGGAMYGAVVLFQNSTLVGNRATGALVDAGGQIHLQSGTNIGTVVSNNIVVSGFGSGIYYGGDSPATFRCNDSWGNTGPNYQFRYPGVVTQTNNVSLDPQFCGAAQENYTLMPTSPCAGGVDACGLIGALDVGCAAIAVEPTTWSRVKLLAR